MTEAAELQGPAPDSPGAVAPPRGAPPFEQRERTCPFPGPRSFDRSEGAFLTGRAREARELLSALVSNPVTLLYSPSGAGKTSLVHTKLMELLEGRSYPTLPIARVGNFVTKEGRSTYVANTIRSWGGDPARTPTLQRFIAALGRARDADGDPALRIAIFDQFEELFTDNRANARERFRFFRQLGKVLEASPDLRVLLMLREEYVASLDPYTRLVPGRLHSRMRLERLTARAARSAVQEPLKLRGIEIANDAADRLSDRLRTVRDAGGRAVLGDYVEPVQLQVVCRRLWFRLPVGATRVTLEDVSSDLGDVRAALITFYDDALAKAAAASKQKERLIRSWIGRRLITESRTRGNAFHGESTTGGMPNRVLEELNNQLIVRLEARAGGTWYELAHDALIEPILDSNARFIATRRARLARLGLFLGSPVLVGVGIWISMRFLLQPALPATRDVNALAQTFWLPDCQPGGANTGCQSSQGREQILSELKAVPAAPLKKFFPPVATDTHPSTTPYVIRLRFPTGGVDADWLRREWLRRADALEHKGYAAPSNVILEPVDAKELHGVPQAGAPNGLQIELDLVSSEPAKPTDAVPGNNAAPARAGAQKSAAPVKPSAGRGSHVPEADEANANTPAAHASEAGERRLDVLASLSTVLPAPAGPVLIGALPPELVASSLAQVLSPEAMSGDRRYDIWTGAPDWSWPLFAVRPDLLRPPEARLVDELFARIARERPELFVAEPWLPHLLKHVLSRKMQSGTEQEFRAELAHFKPATLIKVLSRTLAGFSSLPDAEALFDETFARQSPDDYDCTEKQAQTCWPPSIQKQIDDDDLYVSPSAAISVALGSEVANAVTTTGGRLRDDLLEQLDQSREELFERHGFLQPEPVFGTERNLTPTGFRLDTEEEERPLGDRWMNLVGLDEAKQRITQVYAEQLRRDPDRWVDLATVHALEQGLPRSVRSELQLWSAAETVIIAKYVVLPPKTRNPSCPLDVPGDDGATLAASSWLFPALAVWHKMSNLPECAAAGLRLLQVERRKARDTATQGQESPTATHIARLLADGQAKQAAEEFNLDYRARAGTAIHEFATAYARNYEQDAELKAASAACKLGPSGQRLPLQLRARYEISRLAKDARTPPEQRKTFALCALQGLGELEYNQRARAWIAELDGERSNLSAEQKAVLDYWRLDSLLPRASVPDVFELPAPPELDMKALNSATGSFIEAVAPLDELAKTRYLFDALSSCADRGRTSLFCQGFSLELRKGLPKSAYAALNAAVISARLANNAELERVALQEIANAEPLEPSDAKAERALLTFARIQASAWRWPQLDAPALAKIEGELWALLKQQQTERVQGGPELESVAELAVDAASYSKSPARITQAIKKARLALPGNDAWDIEEFRLALWTGDEPALKQLLERFVGSRVPDAGERWSYPVALAAALVPQELNARVLLNAGASESYPMQAQILGACARNRQIPVAQAELKPSWERIKPSTWQRRIELHDATVWGEVLLGDFMDNGDAHALLEPVVLGYSNAALTQLGMTLSQLQCELHFYRAARLRVAGDPAETQELERVLATGEAAQYEYAGAKYFEAKGRLKPR